MKKLFFTLTIAALMNPYFALAGINLPWSTTFDCPEWNQYSDPLNCDGLTKAGAWTTSDGHYEQITAAANHPGGADGKGQRHWLGDGTNNNSGGIRIYFNTPQTNFWMRWYARWESGFGSFDQFKMLYIYSPSGTGAVFQPGYGQLSGIRFWTSVENSKCDNCGYSALFYPNGQSDGSWQLFEIHINLTNGTTQAWVNENLVINETNVDWGSLTSVSSILIGSNCKDITNGKSMYVDYDDIAISNTGYIGPLVGGGGRNITPPSDFQLNQSNQ